MPPEASVKTSHKLSGPGAGPRERRFPKVMGGGVFLECCGMVQPEGSKPRSQKQECVSFMLRACWLSLLVEATHGCSTPCNMGHSHTKCQSSGHSCPHPCGHAWLPSSSSPASALLCGLQKPATCQQVSMLSSSMCLLCFIQACSLLMAFMSTPADKPAPACPREA